MDLLEFVGALTVLYFLIQIIFWIFLDCDIQLFYASQWGKPISEKFLIIFFARVIKKMEN